MTFKARFPSKLAVAPNEGGVFLIKKHTMDLVRRGSLYQAFGGTQEETWMKCSNFEVK